VVRKVPAEPAGQAGAAGRPAAAAVRAAGDDRAQQRQTRRTPVIDGLVGDQFWIVAEHGRHAHYVRNLERDPHVRVQRRRRWHSGLARVLDHDDPLARARWLADTLGPLHRADPTVARLLGTDLLIIRIDLDHEPSQPNR
jgi:deazaflavin-dependent oxidoreductase (nitroreductase family)